MAGVPVGRLMMDEDTSQGSLEYEPGPSSIIIIVATDAPVLSHQLKRLAKRAALGLGRNGSIGGNGSGDIFIAFSTANRAAGMGRTDGNIEAMPNDNMDPLFAATVNATEEAIINALVAGREMTGQDGYTVPAIDHARLRDILRKYGRLDE